MHRLLPPVLFIALVAPMLTVYWLAAIEAPKLHANGVPYWEVLISAILGLVLLSRARFQFIRANAEIMTFNEPRNFVSTGLYRISRNPMYLGFVLLLLAAALYVNYWWAVGGPVIFFLVANWWYIPAEEKAMAKKFGAQYQQYKNEVRRWL